MKNPKVLRIFIILILLVVMVVAGFKIYQNYLLSPKDNKNNAKKAFVISQGEGISSIADRLEKMGFIRSSNAFTVLAKTSGEGDKIRAGDFKLSASMSSEEILKELTVGLVDKWVTLLEGWRVEEMAAKLNKELGIRNKDFIAEAKEGYMFPDTYLFNPEAFPVDIVSILRANFEKKYDTALQSRIKKLGLTPDEGVILASIVEREARSDEVRKMVASILLKRLNIDMGLNADATIQYALIPKGTITPPESGWWKRHLTRDDLKIDSPYNTYIHRGLPPGPISNPSLSSLEAVANADPKTPYLYYYHDSKGNSHYAKNLEEHNQNVANYP